MKTFSLFFFSMLFMISSVALADNTCAYKTRTIMPGQGYLASSSSRRGKIKPNECLEVVEKSLKIDEFENSNTAYQRIALLEFSGKWDEKDSSGKRKSVKGSLYYVVQYDSTSKSLSKTAIGKTEYNSLLSQYFSM